MEDTYRKAVNKIIREQETIIGPLAYDQARKVAGISISTSGEVSIKGNGKEVLGQLVDQYSQFFGRASIEVCKDALKDIEPSLTSTELPDILK